jgi:hypothetical protein
MAAAWGGEAAPRLRTSGAGRAHPFCPLGQGL